MNKPRLLVTGAAGRVGRLLRPILLENYDLHVCDILPVNDLQPGETAIIGDLADANISRTAVEGVVGVIHLAAAVAPDLSYAASIGPNYQAVLNLLEACREFSVERFIFASSHHAIGLHPLSSEPYDPQCEIAPDGFYGLSKAFGEAACSMYAHRFGIKCLILRIGNADEQVVDGRRERLWVSARDMVQLIGLGLSPEAKTFEIVYGISECPDALLKNSPSVESRYQPFDFSTDNRSSSFKPLKDILPEEGAGYIGGYFAKQQLPDPRPAK
ncbi:NAD-dependent epimerase/dehydratase family protein [Pseudomonas neuropathica]